MKKTTSAINGLTIFDKLYFLFFLLLPFVYNNKLVDPVLIPRQLYLTIFNVIILVFVFKKVQKGELIVDISFLKLPVFIFLAAFLAIVLISFFQSILLSESIYVFSKLMIEVVFFLITTYLLIQNQIQLSVIIKTFILLCLIILLKGLYQVIGFSKFSSDFFDNMISVNASFGHKNLLASVLFLTLPFLLASIVLEEKKWKILSIVLSLAVFVFIWLLQAKAVLVACFVFSILVLCFYFLTQKKGVQPFTTKRILAFGIVFILALSIFTYCNKDKFPRLFDKKSSYERIELWRNSAYMFKEHIFLGVGAGNWQIQFPKYGLSNFADPKVKQGITTFQRPHNDFLWVGCELGIMGLLIYPTIFIFMGYYLIKLIRSTDKNWLYRLLLAAIVGYVLIACVDFPLERIEHQLLLFVIFSIVVADYYRLQFSQDKKAKPTTISYLGFLIIPVLLSLLVAVNRFSGEYHTKKLYSFEQTDNWEKMQREADMAINSFYKIDPTSAPIEWYKGVALFSQGNIQDAKQSFEKAYEQHPYNIHVMNNLASCFENEKNHVKAEEFYSKALIISPAFEEARLNLSAVYYNTQQYEKAFETIDQCDINATDQKYQLFLPAILSSLVDHMAESNKEQAAQFLTIKNNKTELMQLYMTSKKENINFKNYITQHLTNTKP